MILAQVVQGRLIGEAEIELVRSLLSKNPGWHRTRLSRELCNRWNWRKASGQMKDIACRSLLLKLEQRGYFKLPPRKRSPVNHLRNRKFENIEHDTSPIVDLLSNLRPVRVSLVEGNRETVLFKCLLNQYHYLGYQGIVGENIKYLVYDVYSRPLGCLLFGSAAWKTAPRDSYIGWSAKIQKHGLDYVTNNMRFLILPWVRVPHLASHILSQVSHRISGDWEAKYGHPIYLLETFVDLSRFKGTCYQASNWVKVGKTKGRTRNDRNTNIHVPVKGIYLYPLRRNFRHLLCAERNAG